MQKQITEIQKLFKNIIFKGQTIDLKRQYSEANHNGLFFFQVRTILDVCICSVVGFSIKLIIINSCQSMNIQPTCPKCQQRFSNQNPPKNLINCQHVLCLSCLSNEILCPIDRKRLERRKYTIEAFQTNQLILNFINEVTEIQNQGEQEVPSKPSADPEPIQTQANQIHASCCQKHIPQTKQTHIEQQLAKQVPSPATQEIDTEAQEISLPKFEDINFDTCLLHSKTADLICLKDKCLICSNCGLFGQHKNHEMLPYDIFVSSYTTLMEQSYNNFEMLKKSEQQLDSQTIQEEINRVIKEKKQNQSKNIKKIIAGLVQTIKNAEKALIAKLDINLKNKKQTILKELQLSQLKNKVNDYYGEIQTISKGSIDIFRLENIERYIDYVDENNSKSYINKEGEYLIAQIDNYSKTLKKRINDQISFIECRCNTKLNQIITDSFELISQPNKSKQHPKPQLKKKQQTLSEVIKISSPAKTKRNEQDLLINSQQNEEKQKKNLRSMSPIQPIPKFQQTFDTTFKNSYKQNIITQTGQEFFLKIKQVQLNNNAQLYIPHHKKTVSFGNRSINSLTGLKQNQHKRDNECINAVKFNGKPVSNNSSHVVQRQILSVLNENKKKKKLELPEKYAKVYEQLLKDKVDVLDFGGAFLGDQMILSISQIFQNRNKLRSAKLMNNKISDQIFPDLLFRCRNLYSINLSYNNLTQKSLEWLEKEVDYLGHLSNITISNNKIVLRNVKDRIQNLRKKGIKVSL